MKTTFDSETDFLLENLSEIKMVKPKHLLYHQIHQKINRRQTISLHWVMVAIIILITGIGIELNLSSSDNQNSKGNYTSFIRKSNPIQYYE